METHAATLQLFVGLFISFHIRTYVVSHDFFSVFRAKIVEGLDGYGSLDGNMWKVQLNICVIFNKIFSQSMVQVGFNRHD